MTYALASDLASYLHDAAPANADYLLDVASDVIDELLIGVIYDVDDTGEPTDAGIIATLTKACCAQAAYSISVGDVTGGTAASPYASVTIGDVSASKAKGKAAIDDTSTGSQIAYSPNAVRILRVAGLTPLAITWR